MLKKFLVLLCTVMSLGIQAQLIENFESNTLTWTESPQKGVWEIGVSRDPVSPSGGKVLATNLDGVYSRGEDVSILSSVVTVPALPGQNDTGKVFLQFFNWRSFYTSDYGYLNVTDENGLVLGQLKGFSYYADNKKWIYENVDISKYAGKNIRLSFVLDVYTSSTGVNSFLGWYIDDLRFRTSTEASNAPVFLKDIPNFATLPNSKISKKIDFNFLQLGDVLSFDFTMENEILLPKDSIKVVKEGDFYFLKLNPVKDQIGKTRITLQAKSGVFTSAKTFEVYVYEGQEVFKETFEGDGLLEWTKFPDNAYFWQTGEVKPTGYKAFEGENALAYYLEKNYSAVDDKNAWVKSSSFELKESENGTYAMIFKYLKATSNTCYLNVKAENGLEFNVLTLDKTSNAWQEAFVDFSLFKGQKVELYFTSRMSGYSSGNFLVDNIELLYLGSDTYVKDNFSLSTIENQYVFDNDTTKLVVDLFTENKTEPVFIEAFSGNQSVVDDFSLRGYDSKWVLAFKAKQEGEANITLVATQGTKKDSTIFKVIKPASGLKKDSLVLLKVYEEMGLSLLNFNWKSAPMNTWEGITIGANNRVERIDFYFYNKGYEYQELRFPNSIVHLDSLKYLRFYDNGMVSGRLPNDIYKLAALEELHFAYTRMYGEIPKEIGQLKKLKVLNLQSGEFTGSFPDELGGLESLESFHFSWVGNGFKSRFPVGLYQCTNLKSIFMTVLDLYGGIPEGIGNLKKLESFDVSSCGLEGALPSDIVQLTSLKTLSVWRNSLSKLPEDIGLLQNLTNLDVYENRFSNLPVSIKDLKNLEELNLGVNRFEGEIPAFLYSLTNLKKLLLFSNKFSGEVTDSIAGLKNLTSFNVSNNKIDKVSEAISGLAKLEYVYITNCDLEQLPDFSASTSVRNLGAANNYLSFDAFEKNISKASSPFAQKIKEMIFLKFDLGNKVTIKANVAGINNSYQWYKDDVLLTGNTQDVLEINAFSLNDVGTYHCKVTNSLVTNTTIIKNYYYLQLSDDSNAFSELNDTVYNFSKNESNYKAIFTLPLKDIDGDVLKYKIISSNSDRFKLSQTNVLSISGRTYDTNSEDVVILVSDGRGSAGKKLVKINYYVEPVNDNVFLGHSYSIEIDELHPKNQPILQIEMDDSSKTPLHYLWMSSQYSDKFELDSTGKIWLKDTFYPDYDRIENFNLVVNIKNELGQTYTSYIRVAFKHASGSEFNFDPIVKGASFTIKDTISIGTIVGNIPSSDFDGDLLSYQFESGNSKYSILQNGDIVTNALLTYPIDSLSLLKIRVLDKKGGNTYVKVIVRVEKVISGIEVGNTDFSINENLPVATVLGSITAKELSGATLTYEIIGDKSLVPFDFINTSSNELIVVDSAYLDFEKRNFVRFEVLIKSSNGLQKTVSVTVDIKDVLGDEFTGLNENDWLDVSIFPTITEGKVRINSTSSFETISVQTIEGKELKNFAPNGLNKEIDLSPLPEGMYLIKISNGSAIKTQKIIIRR